jgi:hypothetical protein
MRECQLETIDEVKKLGPLTSLKMLNVLGKENKGDDG